MDFDSTIGLGSVILLVAVTFGSPGADGKGAVP